MFWHSVLCALVTFGAVYGSDLLAPSKAVVTVQATNNTKVPNIVYTVDAVESLKEAYSIYADESLVGEAYLELFSAKHAGNWNVAVGYTTLITKSSIYVETVVTGTEKNMKQIGSDKKGMVVRIFN